MILALCLTLFNTTEPFLKAELSLKARSITFFSIECSWIVTVKRRTTMVLDKRVLTSADEWIYIYIVWPEFLALEKGGNFIYPMMLRGKFLSLWFLLFVGAVPLLWSLSPIDVTLYFNGLGIFDYLNRACWSKGMCGHRTVDVLHRWIIELKI